MTWTTARVRASAGVGTLVLVMAFAGPAAGQRVVDVSAPHFYVALLQIPAYTQLVLETTGCVAPADPVFQVEPPAEQTEPAPNVAPNWDREVDIFERIAAIPARDQVTPDEVRAGLAAAAAEGDDGAGPPTKAPHEGSADE